MSLNSSDLYIIGKYVKIRFKNRESPLDQSRKGVMIVQLLQTPRQQMF